MKKIYTTLFAAVTIVAAAVSCGKAESEAMPEGGGELKVNIGVAPLGPDTKAIKNGWETGDIINIWFDSKPETSKAEKAPDLRLTRNAAGKWDASELKSGVQENLKAEGVIYGFWEGSNSFDQTGSTWVGAGDYLYFPGVRNDLRKTTGVYGYLAAGFGNVEYTYDKTANELSAEIKGWSFGGVDCQIVVTGLPYEKGRYILFSDEIGIPFRIDIGEKDNPTECNVIPDLYAHGRDGGRIAGIANEENSVAFVGCLTYNNSERTYSFTIMDGKKEGKEYTFTKENLTLNSESGSKVIGLKISKDKFVAADGSKLGD